MVVNVPRGVAFAEHRDGGDWFGALRVVLRADFVPTTAKGGGEFLASEGLGALVAAAFAGVRPRDQGVRASVSLLRRFAAVFLHGYFGPTAHHFSRGWLLAFAAGGSPHFLGVRGAGDLRGIALLRTHSF